MNSIISNDMTIAVQQLDIPTLRPWQEKPMEAILAGKDIFASAPTGGGKSMLYQAPAVMEEGHSTTIVVSPVRSLQLDQVTRLKCLGIKAELLNSDLSKTERQAILSDLSNISLIYTTPEQLEKPDLLEALKNCRVARIAVDEAHVLPQAKSGFRKTYGRIDKFIARLPERPQVIACTATATPGARKRILKALGIPDAKVFCMPVRRNNLAIQIKKVEAGKSRSAHGNMMTSVERELKRWDKDGEEGGVILYCATVRDVKRTHKWLKGRGWHAKKYTGKTSKKKRTQIQQQFLSGEVPIIVAANAFGLGIDKSDVRLVIHAGLPLGMSGYVQEIGRAGRDGKKARCVLFYTAKDVNRNKNILNRGKNRKAARQAIKDLNALAKLLKSGKCIWRGIERYFGEKPGHRCKKCCRCKAKAARK